MIKIRHSLLATAFLFGFITPTALAQWISQFNPSSAKETHERGEKVKLATILDKLKQQYGGYHTNAALFSTPDGGLEYRINWVTLDGRVLFIQVNAQNGDIVAVRGQ